VEHLLTQPRSPTTTGKIERFHRTLRAELDTTQVFRSLAVAQQALDEWVGTTTPIGRTSPSTTSRRRPVHRARRGGSGATRGCRHPRADRTGEQWVARTVGGNGVVCVSWQQVSVGKHYAGLALRRSRHRRLLQFWVGDQLLKTVSVPPPATSARRTPHT
jgi:hypothetical protein